MVNVRYMVKDVEASIAFYVSHLGFTLLSKTLPAFADVKRGDLRLLLSGRRARLADQCPTAGCPSPADGTGSSSWLMILPLKSTDFEMRG